MPVCCRHSALTSTRRPAISSRNGEDSSGVRRAWPLQPLGGGADHLDVHCSASSQARIAASASGFVEQRAHGRGPATSAQIMSGRRRRISAAVLGRQQVGIGAPDQRQRQARRARRTAARDRAPAARRRPAPRRAASGRSVIARPSGGLVVNSALTSASQRACGHVREPGPAARPRARGRLVVGLLRPGCGRDSS